MEIGPTREFEFEPVIAPEQPVDVPLTEPAPEPAPEPEREPVPA